MFPSKKVSLRQAAKGLAEVAGSSVFWQDEDEALLAMWCLLELG